MRALTVVPGDPGSGALTEVPEPDPRDGSVLVATRSTGTCGTDRELLAGHHGAAPSGEDRRVLGHGSLGEVLEAAAGSGLRRGDSVVGVVRRPDPVPCLDCAAGEPDMCRNGRYIEHGPQGAHGFARCEPDVVVACTGAATVLADVVGGNAVVCLTGVSSAGGMTPLDLGALDREWVLENDVAFGTVNANRRHDELGAAALAAADPAWLSGLPTRQVPLEDDAEALVPQDDDVKTVVVL